MATPKKIGKYEIIAQVATGGFGVIYKAWDPFIKRAVALKMCATPDEEVRQRFFREAQFVGNLVHRNITLVFDFGVEDEIPFIVQEFLTGYDLDTMVKAGVLGDVKALASILLQVCDGLEFAHNRGIIHRDIKPSNIRVLEDGTVKIMDFGIAKSLEGGSKLTQTGIALGTAGYLAPEQIQGAMVDPRTDVFAIGVLAYELITSVRPFEGKSLSNVLYKILNEQPPAPSTINPACSPELEGIIQRCLAKQPGARFQTARDLANALRAIPVPGLPGADGSVEQTTGFLRTLVEKMESPEGDKKGLETADLAVEAAPAPEARLQTIQEVIEPPQPVSELSHPPELEEVDEERRNPVLVIFIVLVSLLIATASVLYFSKDVQDIVFGEQGAPWIPTPTPTPTVTPTPTPTATPTPAATLTPTPPPPTPTPTPAPVNIRVIVDPPAELWINGTRYKSDRISAGSVRLLPGDHVFLLKYPDYPQVKMRKTVTSSTKMLSLVVDIGQITIMADPTKAPPGGTAYLDGEVLGRIPILRKKVAAGKHQLVIRWDGKPAYRKEVTIKTLPSPELRVIGVFPPE